MCEKERDRERRVKEKMKTVEHPTSFSNLFRLFSFTKEIRTILQLCMTLSQLPSYAKDFNWIWYYITPVLYNNILQYVGSALF